MRALPALGLALALGLSACADLPELDGSGRALGPAGAPPPLLPYAALEAATAGGATRAAATDDLEARAAALNARAALLRQPLSAEQDIDALRARLARLR